MQTPFIYDSAGKWMAGGGDPEAWNWLTYERNPNITTQFDDCNPKDSTFYLNSVTPHEGQEAVSEIYFRKLNY